MASGFGHDRRRSTRIATNWTARYALYGRTDGWYDCRVIDVSLGGAALELFGPAPLDGGGGIHVLLRPQGEPIELHLHALGRNVGPSTKTGIRVGVEWHEITRHQAELLNHFVKQMYIAAS